MERQMVPAKRIALFAPFAALLSACEPPPPVAYVTPPPARDRLFTLSQITPGRLEYAQEPDAFAPILTRSAAYPSQDQANDAFDRENMAVLYPTKGPYVIRSADPAPSDRRAASVHLFACRPSVLNSTTGRIDSARGHGVHCATDFLDRQGRRLSRETVNYYYDARAWHMRETNAPASPAPWIDPESSPTDYFSWLSFGKRSTPYN
jgi:hypothetical protein